MEDPSSERSIPHPTELREMTAEVPVEDRADVLEDLYRRLEVELEGDRDQADSPRH